MAIVLFDPDEFREYYPKFEDQTDKVLEGYFNTACLLLDNTEKSTIPYEPEKGVEVRKTLLYLLMCHLATLASLPIGTAGPLTSATEGSVSAGYGMLTVNSGKWFALTPCGQAFWQAILPYLIGGQYFPKKYRHPWG